MVSSSSFVRLTAAAALAMAAVLAMLLKETEASCTVKNTSGHNVLVLPTIDADVSVSISVAAGASVDIPASKLPGGCYLQNAGTGHKLGPFDLQDGSVVACVDGSVSGTVDVYATSQSLVSSVLQLLTCLPLVNVCLSL